MTAVRVWVLLLLTMLTACGQPAAECRLIRSAQLVLQVQNRLLVAPIEIDGKPARLIVDTGAEKTILSEASVIRLGLPRDSRFITHSRGIGGASSHADVTLANLVIGGLRVPAGRVAVGDLQFRSSPSLVIDGLLGADILGAFEMDLNVPEADLTLYQVRHCLGTRPNWTKPAAEVKWVTSHKGRMLLPFELDGTLGMAILDTGAERTVIGQQMARRLGLTDRTMAGDAVSHQHGAGPATLTSRLHRFNLLRIGPIVVRDPAFPVLPAEAGVSDALIGEDVLQGRRVWVSIATGRLFVSLLPEESALPK